MYQCNACKFKGKQFPGGACPGCDSKNISRLTQQPQSNNDTPKSTLKSKLTLIGVWGLFAYALYDLFKQ